MEILKGFRNRELVLALQKSIESLARHRDRYALMEVCGTHTQAIGRWGLRGLLPSCIRLVSGPGCPVCVTPGDYIDNACRLACERGVIVATFGDLVRVPGNRTSLEEAKGRGADIRTLYSAFDALAIAREAVREVVFLAIGFETTAAGIAATVAAARAEAIGNLSFYTSVKRVPPALGALIGDPEVEVDGFILPGHVSVIIGMEPYGMLADHGKAGAIAGFEPVDILRAVEVLVRSLNEGRPVLENLYARAVRRQGNARALRQMAEVFEPCPAAWRGIGTIPGSGCALRGEYRSLDAALRFGLPDLSADAAQGCACGDVLRGRILPVDCPMFGKACTPASPAGPCMVSSEGSCSAWLKYGA